MGDDDTLDLPPKKPTRYVGRVMTGGGGQAVDERTIEALASGEPDPHGWRCAALRQGTAGGNDPVDCDWPTCGCDPYATKVIDALIESGHLTSDHR